MKNKTYTLFILFLILLSCGVKKTIFVNDVNTSSNYEENIILFPSSMADKRTAIFFVLKDWNLKPEFILTESLPDKLIKENLMEIRLNNKAVWKRLDLDIGKESKKKFETELIAELGRLEIAQQIIKKNIKVQIFLDLTHKTGEFVIPVPYSKSNNSEYIWRMWRNLPNGASDEYGDGTFADFKIDLKKETVEIIKYEE